MNRVHPLSTEEIQALKRLHRETHDANVRSRCDMILCSNAGLSPPKIAERVRFSRDTVVRFIRRYEREGLSGLMTKPRSGRPRRATDEYIARLLQAIETPPRGLGLPFSNWTTAHLAQYLAAQTGIELSPRQVENHLKAHDWFLRRPVRSVKHKQNPEEVAEKKSPRRMAGPSGPRADPVVWRLG